MCPEREWFPIAGCTNAARAAQASRRMPVPKIDRRKLREWIRRSSDDLVYSLLDDAIELLPATKLTTLVSPYIDAERLLPDKPAASENRTLLAEVAQFDARGRAGQYYESFSINSRNRTTRSMGTRAFIADYSRLIERCVIESRTAAPLQTRASLEVLFALLRYIDECNDDVLFFADDAGTWEFGIDWVRVFPVWFHCLSKTSTGAEYARLVVQTVDAFDVARRDQHLAAALKIATPAQHRALATATNAITGKK